MQQAEKILSFAAAHKSKLKQYFAGECYPSSFSKIFQFSKHERSALWLHSIETPIELCRFLKTPFLTLSELINNPTYHHYTIKKKRGGERHIYAPDKNLKVVQKRFNYFLQAYYSCIKPSEVLGFVINPNIVGAHFCNIVENAQPHTGKKHLLNIDLKDFFPSIAASSVKAVFSSPYFNFSEQLATALTLLTTYEGKLPIGTPTSPVISNFVCMPLDADIRKYCLINNIQYTRYADDLTFSSDTIITSDIYPEKL